MSLAVMSLQIPYVAEAQSPRFVELVRTYSEAERPWIAGMEEPMDFLSYRPITSSGTELSFDRIPESLALSYVSLSASAQQTAGLGDVVMAPRLEGYAVDRVEVVLVTWARAKDWPALASTDEKGYSHPVTASLFGVNRGVGDAVTFSPLGSSTAWIQVPWRPETLSNGKPYPYSGFAFKATIPFLTPVALPQEYAVLVSYNTELTGFAPIGVAGPYNGLNIALSDLLPSAGVDVDQDAVLWVKHPQWYYPAANWGSIGSPMIRTVLRQGTEPSTFTAGVPVNTGSYHLIARQNLVVMGEAFARIDPAPAEVFLSGAVISKGSEYQGASVLTNPPGLPVRVTYNGGEVIPERVGIHRVRAVVADTNYFGEAWADLTVTGPTYENWIDSMLPAADLREADLDPDADGLSNLVEYALGSDPELFTAHPLKGLIESRGDVVVVRQKWLPSADLLLERSADLRVWSDVKPEIVDIDGESEGLRISSEPVAGGSCFFRLRAVRMEGGDPK